MTNSEVETSWQQLRTEDGFEDLVDKVAKELQVWVNSRNSTELTARDAALEVISLIWHEGGGK